VFPPKINDSPISASLCHFGLLDSRAVLPSNVTSREYRCRISIPTGLGLSTCHATGGDPVNDALRLKAEHERRLRGIDDFIAAYEAEHGVITDEEMEAAYQRAKARAIVICGGHVIDDTSEAPHGPGGSGND
jgi:hypothetical protein